MNYAFSSLSNLSVYDYLILASVFLAGFVYGNCFRFVDLLVVALLKCIRGLIHVK